MKKYLSLVEFYNEFVKYGRENRFSYEGFESLYSFLEVSYDGEYVLDVIGLCCDFAEYDIDDAVEDYAVEDFKDISDNTLVIFVEGKEDRVIIQSY